MTEDTTPEGPTPADRLRALVDEWWQPPAELVATLPKGGTQLSYLGHADTTRALIECDPEWTWAPMATDDNGLPVLDRDERGRPVGMWIWMSICGVERPAYGSCEPGDREAVKILIGDAIRNAALRAGVAGALWSRADRAPAPGSIKRARRTTPQAPEAEAAPPPGTAELKALQLLARDGTTADDLAAVLKAEGIEGRAALTDQATFDKARTAVMAALGESKVKA